MQSTNYSFTSQNTYTNSTW